MAEKKVSEYLKDLDLIDDIGPEVRSRLSIRELARSQPIISAAEPVPELLLLVSGRVRVSILMESGAFVILSVERPVSILGGMEIVNRCAALSRVEALDAVVCLALSAADFAKYGEWDPGFLALLYRDLSRKLAATSRSSAMKNTAVLNRLSWYLLSEEDSRVPFTRQADLASFLGTSERHLNRELRFLESRGALETVDREIRILDRTVIEEYFPDRF